MGATMFESLTLSDLRRNKTALVRRPTNTRPALWVVEEKGVQAVVKDFSTGKFIFRNIVGRFLVWREHRAYLRLEGVTGVPALYRVINGQALVLERVEGSTLEELEDLRRIPPSFFEALKALVDRFHERGICHCDLKRAPNTICGADGIPYVIDWAASISESEFRWYPLTLIYGRFLSDDYKAVIKLKLRHRPEAVTPEERAQYAYRGRGERVVRAIRDRLRAWLKKIA